MSVTTKYGTVFIVILLVIVSIAQNLQFGTTKAASEQRSVTITTEVLGIHGYPTQSVQLSEEQLQTLRQYLASFQSQLENVTTSEEAIPLYKEAVVTLGDYNLLPHGMSIQQAQSLTLSRFHSDSNLSQSIMKQHDITIKDYNMLCLISANIENCVFYNPLVCYPILTFDLFTYGFGMFVYALASLLHGYYHIWFPLLFATLVAISEALYAAGDTLTSFLGKYVEFTSWFPIAFGQRAHSMGGQSRIQTIGLLGAKNWDGTLQGTLFPFHDMVAGFVGFKLNDYFYGATYFLGSALVVGISGNSTAQTMN